MRFPLRGRHQRTPGHLAACHECASVLRRERQYLERLRDAPIPAASDDLTARLLAHTSQLAAAPLPAAAHPPARRTAARLVAMTAGSTVAAAGVLAAGVYAAAGDPVTGTATASPAALSHVSSQTPADGRTLTAGQLAGLRSEGWSCPELEAMGFHLESAKAVVIDGQPAITLRLTDGYHYATVTEQHPPGQAAGVQDATVQDATVQDGSGQPANPVQLGGTSPWSATYRAPGRTFTYVSDLPADRADDALPILQKLSEQARTGLAAGTPEGDQTLSGESVGTRLQRGINNIVALFAR